MGNADSRPAAPPANRWYRPLHIALLGRPAVGKKKMIAAACGDMWNPHPPSSCTIGVDFRIVPRHVFSSEPEEPLRVLLWPMQNFVLRFDAGGYLKRLLHGKHGVMLCFDVTDRESLAFLRPLAADVRKNASLPHLAVTVVGLKADAPQGKRAVSEEEGRAMADLLGARYAECSAKTGEGVEELVMQAAEEAAYALQFATVGPFELRDGPGQITALLRGPGVASAPLRLVRRS